jgi:hypothetical protein
VLGRDRLQVVQAQRTERRVLDDLGAEVAGEDLVLGPQCPEPLALALQRLDQAGEAGVADPTGVLGAKAGERGARRVIPLRAAALGAREQPPQQVRRAVGRGGRDAEQTGRRPVPREDVGTRAEQVGGVRGELLDERRSSGGASCVPPASGSGSSTRAR